MNKNFPNQWIQEFIDLSKENMGEVFWHTISYIPSTGEFEIEFDEECLIQYMYHDTELLADAIQLFLEDVFNGWIVCSDIEIKRLPHRSLLINCILELQNINDTKSIRSHKMLNMRKLSDAIDAIISDLKEHADDVEIGQAINYMKAAKKKMIQYSQRIVNNPFE